MEPKSTFTPVNFICRLWSTPSCNYVRHRTRSATKAGPVRWEDRWKTAGPSRAGGMRVGQFSELDWDLERKFPNIQVYLLTEFISKISKES